ncbi:hypothetical protein HF289_10985 [Acidithiobacillus ferrooxidans]|uniref:hypothetical protein n=1 Tax=Acidithiobacillus ferrooxidans TaxID=920 RepID=UPI001C0697BE|nr:hypothetical protein [Acidithiobacillus ferrooxidans]MBU2857368.1 hypothetical protein [Acidithiobacillus ferrooxidans]MBU2862071.1 hypothetical protein [Acidithiobacillus ferrooxidans]
MNLRIMTALAIAAIAPVAAADTLSQALDTIGVYGEVAATPSSASASVPSGSVSANGGNTNGGVGITMTGVNQELWYTHLSADYAFGAPINGGSITGTLAGGSDTGTGSAHVSGHSMAFNARIGKLFAIGEDAAVGPYLAYQYADFKTGLDGYTAAYRNNAVGGGAFGALVLSSRLSVTGHLGYLAGVSASASAAGYGANNPPSSGVLQIGAKADYRFDPDWSVFGGIDYDHYSASYSYVPYALNANATINDIRGIVGMAYHF